MCGVNSQEEREREKERKGRARGEFPRGPRLGQGKMSGALEVRRGGGEEVRRRGEVMSKKTKQGRGVMGISEEGVHGVVRGPLLFLL